MRYDLAILGSGPSACALAIRASQAGMRVAIIGRSSAKRYASTPETIPGTAKKHFEELSLEYLALGFVAGEQYLMLSAWGTSRLSTRSSIYDVDGPGFLINRLKFDTAMLANAEGANGVVVINGTIKHLEREKEVWTTTLFPAMPHLQADFVVDASGRHSSLARLLGVKRITIDRQVCIEVQAPTNDYPQTLVESAPDGWWFSAPIENERVGISWFTDASLAREAINCDEAFHTSFLLAEHTSRSIEPRLCSRKVVRPSETSVLSRFAGEGWLAIGDAAIAPDPLSSQGVFAALESSQVAVASITAYLSGEVDGLQQYTEYQRNVARHLVRDRQKFYSMERRWPQSSFWCHRSLSMPSYVI